MTDPDPPLTALVDAVLVWQQEIPFPDDRERAMWEAAEVFVRSRHTLRDSPNSKADDEFGSAEALRAQHLLAEIAKHPKSALIEALADAMHSIEDDDGNGRHISYYRSLAYATVEILPALFYDEDATCDEPGCSRCWARHVRDSQPETRTEEQR